MRLPVADLPANSVVVIDGGLATVTIGEQMFRAEVVDDQLVLYPERSAKQRDVLKMLGRLVD